MTSALDEGEWSESHNGRCTPGEKPAIPIVQEVVWALEQIRTLRGREKFLSSTENRTPLLYLSTSNLVAIPTKHLRLTNCDITYCGVQTRFYATAR
jgi:hypothetical protein